jgi:hypothetical protein
VGGGEKSPATVVVFCLGFGFELGPTGEVEETPVFVRFEIGGRGLT